MLLVDVGSGLDQVLDVVRAWKRAPVTDGADQPLGQLVGFLYILHQIPHVISRVKHLKIEREIEREIWYVIYRFLRDWEREIPHVIYWILRETEREIEGERERWYVIYRFLRDWEREIVCNI